MIAKHREVPAAADTGTIPLHGDWRRTVGGRFVDWQRVPGAFQPVGECTLATTVALPAGWGDGWRCFLVTEGVLSQARFRINGRAIGSAGPWITTRLELPPGILGEDTLVEADISDLQAPFGPVAGRGYQAGLQRPIRLERRPRTFVASLGFRYNLAADSGSAACRVVVEQDGPAEPVAVELIDRATGRVVARAEAGAGGEPAFTLEAPRLWSPERPDLYLLRVRLGNGDAMEDTVGFRRIEARGRDFFLNGRRLVLKGVCRHEFIAGLGYAPSEAETRRDLGLIRAAGFNYIRLVHSPHGACVSRIASELGILVSEEPGVCHDDLSRPETIAAGCATMAATVRRDRTQPSVFAWLLYNEADPSVAYGEAVAKVARDLDPGRLLGIADCSGRNDDIKAMADAARLDFIGVNVYSVWMGDYLGKCPVFADRPLVLTEYGGWLTQQNAQYLTMMCDLLARCAREDEPMRFAGASFWCWADYEEYRRDHGGALRGWQEEGLLDQWLKPKPDLAILNRLCWDVDHPAPRRPARPENLSRQIAEDGWAPVPLDGVADDETDAERALATMRRQYLGDPPALSRAVIAGVDLACRHRDGMARPLLLGAGTSELTIPVGRQVTELAVLGHSAYAAAFPGNEQFSVHHRGQEEPVRALGAPAAEYVLVFDDGEETVTLRHGLEIVRANEICRWWRTDPVAPNTTPGFRAPVHPHFELARADVWRMTLPRARQLRAIRWRALDAKALLTLYAISTR